MKTLTTFYNKLYTFYINNKLIYKYYSNINLAYTWGFFKTAPYSLSFQSNYMKEYSLKNLNHLICLTNSCMPPKLKQTNTIKKGRFVDTSLCIPILKSVQE